MDQIWQFLDSSFFVAIVTLLAGLVAYWLYRKRNKDYKKDAANILLLEIQNAERLLRVAKTRMQKDRTLVDHAYAMPTESWGKYKYMFVRDFDRDEWDTVTFFYERCRLFDEAVRHKSTSFQKNEAAIRSNMHRITSDYVKELIEDPNFDDRKKDAVLKTIDTFQLEYSGLPSILTLYAPQKPIDDAKSLLEGLNDNLSQTSIGVKLKKVAGLK